MIKKITLVGLMMFLFGGKAFALFPTDEMLADPLFDSLFVLHNDEERRVDDSLYEVYGHNDKSRGGSTIELLTNDDIRVSKNIRKVIPMKIKDIVYGYAGLYGFGTALGIGTPKGSSAYLKEVNYSSRFVERNYLNRFLKREVGELDSSFYNSKKIEYSKLWVIPPKYENRRDQGEINYSVISPVVERSLNQATVYCLEMINRKMKSKDIEFFILGKGETFNSIDLGCAYKGVRNYIEKKGTIRFYDDMKFKNISIEGTIEYFGLDISNDSYGIEKYDSKSKELIKKTVEQYIRPNNNVTICIGDLQPLVSIGRRKLLGMKDSRFGKIPKVISEVIVFTDDWKYEVYSVGFNVSDSMFTKPIFLVHKKYYHQLYPTYYYMFKNKMEGK